jgi:hypothetical protein
LIADIIKEKGHKKLFTEVEIGKIMVQGPSGQKISAMLPTSHLNK